MSFVAPAKIENAQKKTEVDNMFNIWLDVAGPGDKVTLLQNQDAIKKDLIEKLDVQELTALKSYSLALRDMVKTKSTPWSPVFLNSLAYLTANFRTAKEIVGKTSASSVFANFGMGSASKAESSYVIPNAGDVVKSGGFAVMS